MNENIKNIISYFNALTKKSMRFGAPNNVRLVSICLNDDESNVNEIKDYIKNYVNNSQNPEFNECFEGFPKPTKSNKKEANDLIEKMIYSFSDIFIKEKSDQIGDLIYESCAERLEDYIKNTYGVIPKKVCLDFNGNHQEIKGVTHAVFDDVLAFVATNEPVFLVGPAGSGKNFLCEQIAQAMGLDFYFSNALTQEYFLTGFTDAMGVYHPTQFYDAFTKGGLFLLDEMDASIPEVLIKLNAAIANRYFDFPAPIGRIQAHPSFRVIAAGNTYGLGADITYVGRNELDGASLDRFGMIEVDYDERIELSKASGDEDLVKFAHEVRNSCKENGITLIFSYRAIERLSKLMEATKPSPKYNLSNLLKMCVFKGLGSDDLRHIYNGLKSDNIYKEALYKMFN